MPLPDANKRSPRVYTNLQNIDLDSVTFANVQATGNPIAIEEMNEDEMRRLVLVNLARLVCAGEWNGLLTAGGGGGAYSPVLPNTPVAAGSASDMYVVSGYAPYGNGSNTETRLFGSAYGDHIFYYPFVAAADLDISNLEMYITQAAVNPCNLLCGFFADSDGVPSTLIGKTSVDATSTGAKVMTSFLDSGDAATTVSLVAGTQYWFAFGRDTADEEFRFYGASTYNAPMVRMMGEANFAPNAQSLLQTIALTLAIPASQTATDLESTSGTFPMTALIN